ncbi:LUD domain-containing protein [Tersicoccus sp. Bi-70]|uniref:LutC/YkgG family protein n=1 Tax=Tersicoccus sp. Bi-70 TaxID=1897634 RepID=UPI000977D54E|nr:LUD domain-containing protein [Tersicoccus sp. Bi-70]OMH34235.1 lactate utilization protein C [Tersicoccus sp. Bi-70]
MSTTSSGTSSSNLRAKEEILARIRAALDDGRAETDDARAGQAPVDVPRDYRHSSTMSEQERIEQLVDRLVDYRAEVEVIDAADLVGAVARRLEGAASYVVPPALDEAGHPLAEIPTDARRMVDSPAAPLDVQMLDQADAVITSSAVSIAQTGTIILDGSTDQGRRAISLVPDHHICLVPVETIVALVPEAVARLEPTRPTTLISGPSATSDIELERVEGVHGPRRLDVLIVR